VNLKNKFFAKNAAVLLTIASVPALTAEKKKVALVA